MTIDELLDTYRNVFAMTELEKGDRFERLMKNFLLTYPVWRGTVENVWRWREFPFRDELGGKDLGIDLVVKTLSGDYRAVQCKFYAESSTITKEAVDSFFSNATRTFDGDKKFSSFIWISTTDKYTDNAREMFKGRENLKIIDLSTLRRVQVNWALLDNGFNKDDARIVKKLRDYQITAVNAAQTHYQKYKRGQLIMACGTGKTFTALKIAESLAPDGKILFLVPSISLLSQTLEEWAADSVKPLNALCICSDSTAAQDVDEIADVNLPLPPTTDTEKIADALKNSPQDKLTVVFSTYQSLDKVADAKIEFDLIICDEAHRTTGSSKDLATQFTAVHDENFIHGKKRMYMTATPRMFTSDALKKAADNDINVWSMDDAKIYGREFYRLNFGEAVAKKLLSDYKVLVLTLNEKKSSDKKSANDAAKISGTINALAKKMTHGSAALAKVDPALMHTAVAFCPKITESKIIAATFKAVAEHKRDILDVTAFHVDGTMSAHERAKKISLLKTTPLDGNICRILTNVRCLSEGVDVPALDAVIFMAAKKSKVEIVQAVGRVMRKAPDKKYGYIIIPVVVPLDKNPEDILAKSKTYDVIWDVLNALRSHDARIDIFIEDIKLQLANNNPNPDGDGHIFIGGAENDDELDETGQLSLNFGEWQDFLYARMVERVGNRRYWEQWAADIADIAERHISRINELISVEGEHRRAFYNFIDDLQKNLNPNVTPKQAIEMLAQHLISRPVFDALFADYSFVKNNPVSQSLEKILAVLDTQDTAEEAERLKKFAESVSGRCKIAHTPEDKQRTIIELYDKFFELATPKTVDKFGIVYTPVEVVDFILRSVDAVLRKHFQRGLTDKNVHILDPFTGTGTFIVRLIQSGLINQRDLQRKYSRELHANEIVLLAYYIAAVNIENAYASFQLSAVSCQDKNFPLKAESQKLTAYTPFNGICLTDTFELYERGEIPLNMAGVMKINSARVNSQQAAPIEVIVGNPPYSVGQRSANDNNQNDTYGNLEDRIAATYAKGTDATNKNALYDSYIKAFRWASDRIKGGGVIGFVTNAGWLDGAAMDGLRKCFAKEFSAIYVFNLRGAIKGKIGDIAKREGQNVFDIMTGVAITILVKNPAHIGDAQIFYRDIGYYLKRNQKLEILNRTRNVLEDTFHIITPNAKADWINQRGDTFDTFIILGDKKHPDNVQTFFCRYYSKGINTARDAWCYNFSQPALESNMRTTIDYYNTHEPTDIDPTKFVWAYLTRDTKARKLKYVFNAKQLVESMHRPFCKSNLYYDKYLNERRYQMSKLFPTGREDNLLICVSGVGSNRDFSALITDKIPSLDFLEKAQCFPLYFYEKSAQGTLGKGFGDDTVRRDGVSDFILNRARELYGGRVDKADLFYYVYGFLHLPLYREKFANELRYSLPRIILVDDAQKFWHLSRAGRELAEIHLHYESQPPAQVEIVGTEQNDFRVQKMRFAKDDRTTLIYNRHIKIKHIPTRCFDYVVNGRSPLEWLIDRYQIKTDKASGIINDANAWGIEHDNPRYILDLILSCITVSLKTLDIVENLPEVDFDA